MNLLNTALDSLESYERGDWNVLIFLLQIWAWKKLSQANAIQPQYQFEYVLNNTHISGLVKDVFEELRRSDVIGNNSVAFEVNPTTINSFSESRLYYLMHLISHASREPSYENLTEAFSRFGRMSDFIYSLPTEITNLILGLGKLKKDDAVYCPFDSSLMLALKASDVARDVSVEVMQHSPFPFLLNILFNQSLNIKEGNPITDEPNFVEDGHLKQFDVVLSNPPFGTRYQEMQLFFDSYNRFPEKTLFGDVVQIRHILAQTKRRAVVVVSDGILFRTTTGEKQFKTDLVESGIMKAVIALPPGLLTYSGVSLSLIVLDKEEKSDSILFIDTASEHFHEKRKGNEGLGLGKNKLVNVDEILQIFEQNLDGTYSRLVSRDECAENDYNLLPQRYVLRGEGPQLDNILKDTKVQLEELVEFIRPQTLKDYIADEGEDCFEVSVGDIGADGIIQTPKKIIYLSAKADSRVYQQKLSPADVLLAIKGSTGRVGFVPEDLRDTWFANQSFLVLRMRYNKYFENSIVLFRYLTSPIGQALLQRLVGGTTVPMLQTKDIKALPVVVPPTEEQNTIVEDHQKIVSIYREIAELEAEAEAIGKKHWKLD